MNMRIKVKSKRPSTAASVMSITWKEAGEDTRKNGIRFKLADSDIAMRAAHHLGGTVGAANAWFLLDEAQGEITLMPKRMSDPVDVVMGRTRIPPA